MIDHITETLSFCKQWNSLVYKKFQSQFNSTKILYSVQKVRSVFLRNTIFYNVTFNFWSKVVGSRVEQWWKIGLQFCFQSILPPRIPSIPSLSASSDVQCGLSKIRTPGGYCKGNWMLAQLISAFQRWGSTSACKRVWSAAGDWDNWANWSPEVAGNSSKGNSNYNF